MLHALIHRKLSRPEEELEDLLTSNVFGTLSYTGDVSLLSEFLGTAITAAGTLPLAELPPWVGCTYKFWPWLENGPVGCEPDVLLTVSHADGSKSLILIEAKCKSPKGCSPEWTAPPRDQLAREAFCLQGTSTTSTTRRFVVFLTADVGRPGASLLESEQELQAVMPQAAIPIAWTGWRFLQPLLRLRDMPMFRDLEHVLRHLGLACFERIPAAPADLPPAFRFQLGARDGRRWAFLSPPVLDASYQFAAHRDQAFRIEPPPTPPRPWRFCQ